jgi:hypothetical protein
MSPTLLGGSLWFIQAIPCILIAAHRVRIGRIGVTRHRGDDCALA